MTVCIKGFLLFFSFFVADQQAKLHGYRSRMIWVLVHSQFCVWPCWWDDKPLHVSQCSCWDFMPSN